METLQKEYTVFKDDLDLDKYNEYLVLYEAVQVVHLENGEEFICATTAVDENTILIIKPVKFISLKKGEYKFEDYLIHSSANHFTLPKSKLIYAEAANELIRIQYIDFILKKY